MTIHVDGWACSAASIIAMAGDEIIMELGSMMMIHEASSIVWGSKTDMRKEAEVLEQLENGIIDIYMTKANISREEVREKVNAETWFSASTAVELGFANKAEGVEVEPAKEPQNKVGILNELQNILEPNEQTEEVEPIANEGSFNLLKKWR